MDIRYCPHCGTNRFTGARFCPSWGLDYGAFEARIGGTDAEPAHPLLPDAVEMIREYDRASASLLQRRMKIGPARAARLIDQLEARGYVGPPDGSNARQVQRRDAET